MMPMTRRTHTALALLLCCIIAFVPSALLTYLLPEDDAPIAFAFSLLWGFFCGTYLFWRIRR